MNFFKKMFLVCFALLFFVIAVSAVCGNGIIEFGEGEECDDGLDNSDTEPDACRMDCTLASCGDGVTDTGEQCDDGDVDPDDDPGDGTPDGDCIIDSPVLMCRNWRCGDGYEHSSEECDDGNIIDGDGCDSSCTLESNVACWDYWSKTFGAGGQAGAEVKQTFDDAGDPTGYIVTGRTGVGLSDLWLVKTTENGDSCGTIDTISCSTGSDMFKQNFGGSSADLGRSVEQTFDPVTGLIDGYIAAGFYTDPLGLKQKEFYLVKTNLDGSLAWANNYGGNRDDEAYSVKEYITPANVRYYLISGKSSSWDGGTGSYISRLWFLRVNALGTISCNYSGTGNCDFFGGAHFARFIGAKAGFRTSIGYSVFAVDGDNDSFVVAGEVDAPVGSFSDPWLVKTDYKGETCDYSATGECNPGGSTVQFVETYTSTNFDRVWQIQETSDQGYIMAGKTGVLGSPGTDNIWLLKVDELGATCSYGGGADGDCQTVGQETKQFSRAFDLGSSVDEAFSVQQTSDGGYVLFGLFAVGADYNVVIIKTDQFGDTCDYLTDGVCFNGTSQFVASFGGPNREYGYSIQETFDAVAGSSTGYIATGSYGARLWLLKVDQEGKSPMGIDACGVCGNGFSESWIGEECDDGANGDNTDYCLDDCTLTFCGDDVIQEPNGQGIVEECDNGGMCSLDNSISCTAQADCVGNGVCMGKPSAGCDYLCQFQPVGLSVVEIVFEPDLLPQGEDADNFYVIIDSTELGDATITWSVIDPRTSTTIGTGSISHLLVLGEQAVDLNPEFDFSILSPGSYEILIEIELITPLQTYEDRESYFFTVPSRDTSSPVQVPETNLVLLPLLILVVIGILLKK